MNWNLVPAAAEGFTGVTTIDCNTLSATATVVLPLTPLEVAVIVVVPAFCAVTNPDALIVATLAGAEVHVTVAVKS